MIISSYTHALVVIIFLLLLLPCELHLLVKKIKNYRWIKNYFKIKFRLFKRILYLHSSVSGIKTCFFFLVLTLRDAHWSSTNFIYHQSLMSFSCSFPTMDNMRHSHRYSTWQWLSWKLLPVSSFTLESVSHSSWLTKLSLLVSLWPSVLCF